VGIGTEPRGRVGNADLRQQLDHAPTRAAVAVAAAVQEQDFGDLPLDGVERIERGHRLLEDDGDVGAAHVADFALVETQQVAALEQDRARGMARGRIGQKFHHRERGDRFARARFADQRDGLAAADVERNAVDRGEFARAVVERHREDADVEQRRSGRVHRRHPNVLRGSKASRTASPTKISSESMMPTVKKPVKPSHGACGFAFA
jgi:hypothetical protein